MNLSDRFVALMQGPNPCFMTTLMPDGSPQTTQTWVDTDGVHVIINTVRTHQKIRNIERDPRVSVACGPPAPPPPYSPARGRATSSTTGGGAEHIEVLA